LYQFGDVAIDALRHGLVALSQSIVAYPHGDHLPVAELLELPEVSAAKRGVGATNGNAQHDNNTHNTSTSTSTSTST
jgi:hypothetical protein